MQESERAAEGVRGDSRPLVTNCNGAGVSSLPLFFVLGGAHALQQLRALLVAKNGLEHG
jgi:hypothetical protein